MNRIAIVAQLITLAAGVAISGECRGDPVAAPPPVSVVVLVAKDSPVNGTSSTVFRLMSDS